MIDKLEQFKLKKDTWTDVTDVLNNASSFYKACRCAVMVRRWSESQTIETLWSEAYFGAKLPTGYRCEMKAPIDMAFSIHPQTDSKPAPKPGKELTPLAKSYVKKAAETLIKMVSSKMCADCEWIQSRLLPRGCPMCEEKSDWQLSGDAAGKLALELAKIYEKEKHYGRT